MPAIQKKALAVFDSARTLFFDLSSYMFFKRITGRVEVPRHPALLNMYNAPLSLSYMTLKPLESKNLFDSIHSVLRNRKAAGFHVILQL